MSGVAGRSGRRKQTIAERILRGTFDARKHAPSAAPPAWSASDAQLAGLGPDGRALIDRLRAVFDLTPVEGEIALEAAIACDRLSDLRRRRHGIADLKQRLSVERIEIGWQKQFAGLMQALQVR